MHAYIFAYIQYTVYSILYIVYSLQYTMFKYTQFLLARFSHLNFKLKNRRHFIKLSFYCIPDKRVLTAGGVVYVPSPRMGDSQGARAVAVLQLKSPLPRLVVL